MLGRTADSLFWMFRYLERCENIARLIDAGFHISLTKSEVAEDEWASIIQTVGARETYESLHANYSGTDVIDFLLRDTNSPFSVMNMITLARDNARAARTALTRQVWEAVNETWLQITKALKAPVTATTLPDILALIRERSALVQGCVHGTMLRNDVFDFARLGTFIERADKTARILDVKYYVLLPSISLVGTPLDNVQWETILRSVSASRAYRWIYKSDVNSSQIADFIILDQRMPRSIVFCVKEITTQLDYLGKAYGTSSPSLSLAKETLDFVQSKSINDIFEDGLHEFVTEFIERNDAVAQQIEIDYRFRV